MPSIVELASAARKARPGVPEGPHASALRSRAIWDSVFGVTKEEPHRPVQRPHQESVTGGSWLRSTTSSANALKRLLEGMRSNAPGGWSDDRWASPSVFADRDCEGFFRSPSHFDSGVDPVDVDSYFDRPFAYRLSPPIDSSLDFAVESPPDWGCQGFFYRPTNLDSAVDSIDTEVSSFCPFGNAECFTVEGEKFVSPRISLLFLRCSPPTVASLVVTVVVYPFKAVLFVRSWSHVSEEVTERMIPPFADSDASSSVFCVAAPAVIVAPTSHVPPNLMFGRKTLCDSFSRQGDSDFVHTRSSRESVQFSSVVNLFAFRGMTSRRAA